MTGDWRDRAACKDADDPELWFPIGTTGPARMQEAEAKAVCKTCPVIEDCLTWAIDNRQEYGVWGGLGEDERRSLKRRRKNSGARIPVSLRALAVLKPGERYTGAEIGEAVGLSPVGSGGAVGALLKARVIERDGEKGGFQGKQRYVAAYRLVGTGKTAMATSSTARDWHADKVLRERGLA